MCSFAHAPPPKKKQSCHRQSKHKKDKKKEKKRINQKEKEAQKMGKQTNSRFYFSTINYKAEHQLLSRS